MNKSSQPFPTIMYNVDGPNISHSEVVNIAPGEGKMPFFFTLEPNWEAFASSKDFYTKKTL